MKAIVYHGKHDVRYETTPDPKLAHESDAIVRVARTAICGSDLHLWHGGMAEGVGASGGFAIGHVYSGCPATTQGGGSNVFGFSTTLPGGQAEAVRVPFSDTNLFRVPDELTDEQALFLTDILPTGYMGAEMADVRPGDNVVVFGCGPVGTFAQMSARLRGAARVIAVDLDDGRLGRARSLGCDTVNPGKETVTERVLEMTNGLGADATIEAVGRVDLIAQAATVTRPGGCIAVIGVLTEPTATLPWYLMFMKNLSLRTGLVNPQNFIPKLLPLIERGRLDPTVIISHRLPLSEGPHGYDVFAGHKENVLKVVLQA